MSAVASSGFRLRVRYGKTGRLRWLSHLELGHAIERSVRRAQLPFAVTQGYVPKMRVAFGPALPVGTAGERECYEVWLTAYVPAAEALEALAAATPEKMRPVEAWYASADEPSLSAGVMLADYEACVEGVSAQDLAEALGAVWRTGELAVEHKGRHKVFDLAGSLPKEPLTEVAEDGTARVRLAVLIGPEGSLRPESLIAESLSRAGLAGAVVMTTRTDIRRQD